MSSGFTPRLVLPGFQLQVVVVVAHKAMAAGFFLYLPLFGCSLMAGCRVAGRFWPTSQPSIGVPEPAGASPAVAGSNEPNRAPDGGSGSGGGILLPRAAGSSSTGRLGIGTKKSFTDIYISSFFPSPIWLSLLLFRIILDLVRAKC